MRSLGFVPAEFHLRVSRRRPFKGVMLVARRLNTLNDLITTPFELHEGELIYSALARYRDRLGFPTEAGLWQTAFGRRTGVATVDLPGHLNALAAAFVPPLLCPEEIARHHTALPYYATFANPQRAEQALRLMCGGSSSTVFGLLGVRAACVGAPRQLNCHFPRA